MEEISLIVKQKAKGVLNRGEREIKTLQSKSSNIKNDIQNKKTGKTDKKWREFLDVKKQDFKL